MLARERRHLRQTLVDRIGAHAAKGARDLREVSIDLRAADDSPFDERRLARPMIWRIGDAGQTIPGGRGNLDRASDRCPMQQTCGRTRNGGGINDESLDARELRVGHDAAREYRAERSGMKITCKSPITKKAAGSISEPRSAPPARLYVLPASRPCTEASKREQPGKRTNIDMGQKTIAGESPLWL